MNPESQIPETIFGEAINIASADERAAYLDRACQNDPELRGAVEQLVVNHFRAGGFLDKPVAHFAATIDMPGELGGNNWGGEAADPETGMLFEHVVNMLNAGDVALANAIDAFIQPADGRAERDTVGTNLSGRF